MTRPKLIPLARQDLPLGQALPFPVFDAEYTLLCNEGHVISNPREQEALLTIELFRAADWQPANHQLTLPTHPPHLPAEGPPSRFEQLQLSPGAILHLRRGDDGPQAFEAVKLIGWLQGADLLTGALTALGQPVACSEGELLEVKLLVGKGIVTFHTQVNLISQAPYPTLHLRYPDSIDYRKLRKNLRVEVGLPVQASHNELSEPQEGRLSNLSACGGLLELNQLFAGVGDDIQLTLTLNAAGSEHLLSIPAKVRNLHTTHNGELPAMLYGLEFLGLETSEQLVLEHYIFLSLLEPPL